MKRFFSYSVLLAASLILMPLSAVAASLGSWRFDATQNQLEFTTDQDVQPKAQLVTNPTRLVIDLPGIVYGRPAVTQTIANKPGIRSIRVGQFDRTTTRLVIELDPDYTLAADQIRFRGITGQRWIVQLPTPQRIIGGSGSSPTLPPRPGTGPINPTQIKTRIEDVRVTPDGLFIRTSGNPPEITTTRSRDRRQITFDLAGTAVGAAVSRDQSVNRYGISRLQVSQLQTSPPVARLTLNVTASSPDWQATASNLGGIVVVPAGGVTAATIDSGRPAPTSPPPLTGPTATIEAIELDARSGQLIIRANQALNFTTGWDRSSGQYKLTLNNATLSNRVRQPLPAGPISKLQVIRPDARSVVILVQPAPGFRPTEPNQFSRNLLALKFERATANQPLPVPGTPPTTRPLPPFPRIPSGRVVVVIDPGHGGPDPGAVGIGGIQEKEIVLDISRQVTAILAQSGVQPVITRDADIDLDLEPRVELAERVNAAIFVSIHANAIDMSRPDVNGVETYFYDSGEALARTLHASILEGTGARDRRVRSARFFVLRKTSMPSVLLEVGFVTGQEDAARLATASYRTQVAQAIARGILQYVQRGY